MDQREFFDRHAPVWDERINRIDENKIKKMLKLAEIARRDRVLDLACGTGVILPYLREKVESDVVITALDYASGMLEQAKIKYGTAFDYVLADVHDLPFPDEMFDKIVCFNAFPHFQEKPRALAEVFRALTPGGAFIIAHSDSRENINKLHKDVGGVVGEDRLPNGRTMAGLFSDAGYKIFVLKEESDIYFAKGEK